MIIHFKNTIPLNLFNPTTKNNRQLIRHRIVSHNNAGNFSWDEEETEEERKDWGKRDRRKRKKRAKSTRKSFSSPATGYNCYSSWRANRIEFQFGHRHLLPLPPPSPRGNRQQVTTVQRNLISFRECMNVGHGAHGYIPGVYRWIRTCKWRIVGRSVGRSLVGCAALLNEINYRE